MGIYRLITVEADYVNDDLGISGHYVMPLSELCYRCGRWNGPGDPRRCQAFNENEGIPGEILRAEVDHSMPYGADQGLTWKPPMGAPGLTPDDLKKEAAK